MQPSQVPPAKKSLTFLWILIPAVVLISIGSLVFTYNTFFASTVSNITDKNAGVDTKAIEDEIYGSILSTESVDITVGQDGFTHYLNVRLTLKKGREDLTSTQLWGIVHDSYHGSIGKVESIRIRVVNASGDPINLKPIADELGIQYLDNTNSITYSTATLKKEFKD